LLKAYRIEPLILKHYASKPATIIKKTNVRKTSLNYEKLIRAFKNKIKKNEKSSTDDDSISSSSTYDYESEEKNG